MTPAQQQRCPQLQPDLWEKICNGPERCEVNLILKNGRKLLRVPFYDGACGDPRVTAFLPDVVEIEFSEPQSLPPLPPLRWSWA